MLTNRIGCCIIIVYRWINTKNEVYLMYLERNRLNVAMGAWTWTSSQISDSLAWSLDYTGQFVMQDKSSGITTYPIKSF